MKFFLSPQKLLKSFRAVLLSVLFVWLFFSFSDPDLMKKCLTSGKIDDCQVLGKTLWDWLELISQMALPISLFFLAIRWPKKAQERMELAKKYQEERRQNQVKDQILKDYTTQICQILLDEAQRGQVFLKEDVDENNLTRHVVRSLTITTLRRLEGDRERQGRVIYLLRDTKLLFHLLKTCQLNKVNLKGADLEGADLEGADLEGADLQRVSLEKADLFTANLEKANLREANLREAFLREANLLGINLERANLLGAKLLGVNLREADLKEAYLRETQLFGANLERANLRKADLLRADLREANLKEANLERAILFRVKLLGANLERANLERANLIGANLFGANLFGVNLREADLREASLERANLFGANLLEAALEEVSLREANLEQANLRGVRDITPEQIKEAKFWNKGIYDPDFQEELGLASEL